MKKIAIILMSLLVFNMGSLQAATSVSIHIGKGTGCPLGLGICIILLSKTSAHNIELKGDALIINIDEKTLSHDQPDAIPYLKGKSSGVFDAGLNVPADVAKALGATGTITIDPGRVAISYSKGVYSLTVPHHINKPMIEKPR